MYAGVVLNTNTVLQCVIYVLSQMLTVLQIQEWYSIYFLVSWQESKSEREILEDAAVTRDSGGSDVPAALGNLVS